MPVLFSAHMVIWVYAPEAATSSPVPSPNRTRLRSLRCVFGVRYASSPMIGFTPAAVPFFQNSYAPNRLP